MPQTCECRDALELVKSALIRFEAEAGASLAPVFYLSLSEAFACPTGEKSSVRLEWFSAAAHFKRAASAMQPLLDSLRQRREVREIVLVECEESFNGARCRGETWFLEFAREPPANRV